MQVGDLYKVKSYISGREAWNGRTGLFVGRDVIERSDGYKVVNYVFLVGGKRRIVDGSFLNVLERLVVADWNA